MSEQTETLATAVQEAQDQLEDVENALPAEHQAQKEAVEDAVEEAEDAIAAMEAASQEDADQNLEGARKRAQTAIQTAQDEMNALQESVGYQNDEHAELLEAAEDSIERVEDELRVFGDDDETGDDGDGSEGLFIEVNDERKDAPERFMTPLEIVRLFDYDPDNVVLYKARDLEDGSREGDQFLPRDEDIDLRNLRRFTCLPSETPYGAAVDDSVSDLENDTLRQDIERLREEYEVDVKDDPDGNFIQVIIREWPIPSDAYNKDRTDVMIRVPQGYPQQPPDWIYVEKDLRLESGQRPRKHNRNRVSGWLGLSWHINKLDEVSWIPYETDLKWYLDTFCDLRLRQGE